MDFELLNRPLFAEPTAELEREDPWSGPKGFMLGGMALPTRDDLADQYFDAAQVLIAAVKRGDIEDYRLVNPALFLFRHSLELQLKAVTGGVARGHDLASLAVDLDRMVSARNGPPVPGWLMARLRELASIDPGSTAFRYGESRSTGAKGWVAVDGEVHVDVHHLQAVMAAIRFAISNLR